MRKLSIICALLLSPAMLFGQTTVTLNGSTYTTTAYPMFLGGPSGTLALSLQDTSSTGKANATNPTYSVMTSATNSFISGGYAWNGALSMAANYNNLASYATWTTCFNSALLWWAQGASSSDPNGYLALAKACVDHAEDYMDGAVGCDTTKSTCGRDGSWDADYAGTQLFQLAMVYDIVHGQLTGTEITNFANKVLNDNDAAHGGIDTSACTPQPMTLGSGTVTSSNSSSTLTGSGTTFTSYAVGDVVIGDSSQLPTTHPSVLGFISSIGSNTSITLTSTASGNQTAGIFYISPPWNNNCGIIWFLKHVDMAPLLTPTQATYYEVGGGSNSEAPATSNLVWPQTVGYFALGMVLAADDSRAQTLLTQSYNYYLTQEHNFALTSYTAFPEEGASYPHQRQATYTSLLLAMLQNAVVSPPAIGGTLTKRWAQEYYLGPFPYSPINQNSFGSIYGDRYSQWSQGPYTFGPLGSYLLSGTNEGKYLTYLMQQTTANGGRGDYINGGQLASDRAAYTPVAFLYAPNPTNTSQQTDYRTLPTQFIANQTDTATCTGLGLECTLGYTWTCDGNGGTCSIVPPIYAYMISKSDWTATATELITTAGWASLGFDHIVTQNPLALHLYRGAPLIAGDGSCQDSTNNDVCDVGNGLNESVVMLGTFNTNNFGDYGGSGSEVVYAPVTRWAGTVPTGDASSRYAYEMIDCTQCYLIATNPTRVQRHIVHFKKASTQDYVVVYDDIATGSGNLKTAYWHYFVDNGAATISDGTNAITLTRGSTSRLLTSFLAISGSNSLVMTDEGTSYPGNKGYNNTDRVNICGSSNGTTCDSTLTAAEFLTVHLPSTNTSATMPTLTQPSCTAAGGNCAVVQIADSSSPKVAVFARQGATLTAVSFTTTHSGTAQYLVAGMAPGNYNVSVNGTTVASSITVNANDNTLYFESTAGHIVVASGGAAAATPGLCPTVAGCLASPITIGVAASGVALAAVGVYYWITRKMRT